MEFQWKDFSVLILGKILTGCTDFKWKYESDDAYVYGRGSTPLDIQSGNIKIEGTIKLLQSTFDELNAAAKSQNPSYLVTDIRFDVVEAYERQGLLKTNIIKGIKIASFDFGMKQGDKNMEITLPFKALEVQLDV
jgi:hypothetical protein